MPTVAIVDGVKIQFYCDDHPPSHFHVEWGEYRAQIAIDSLVIVNGYIPKAKYRGCHMGRVAKRQTSRRVDQMPVRSPPRKTRVKKPSRIVSAEPVIHGVLKIAWNDGYEGVVDL